MDLTRVHSDRETRKGLSPAETEPTRGLEPLTTCLQDRCATNCATSADPRRGTGRAHRGWVGSRNVTGPPSPGRPPPETAPRRSGPRRRHCPAGSRQRPALAKRRARTTTRRRPGRGPPGLRVPATGEQDVPPEPGAAGGAPATSLQSAVVVEPALQRTHRGRVERAGTVLARVDVALERAHRLRADDAVRRGTDLAL